MRGRHRRRPRGPAADREDLFFSGSDYNSDNFNTGRLDHTRLFDCATREITAVGSPVEDLFCCGHAFTRDGVLVVAGGTARYPVTIGHHHLHWPGLRSTWTFDPASNRWAASNPMNLQPGPGAPPAPAVTIVARGSRNLDLFWVDPADGRIMSRFWDGQWNDVAFPLSLPGAAPLSASIAAVSRAPQHVDLFWVSPQGQVLSRFFADGRWNDGDAGGPFQVAPAGAAPPDAQLCAVSASSDGIDVAWGLANGAVHALAWTGAAGWSAITELAAGVPEGTPHPDADEPPRTLVTAVSRAANAVDVFWVDPRAGSVMSRFRLDGRWNADGPFPLAPARFAHPGSNVAAVARTSRNLDIFWVTEAGEIASRFWANDTWNDSGQGGPFTLPEAPVTANAEAGIAVVARAADHLDLFYVGDDATVATMWWDGAWHGRPLTDRRPPAPGAPLAVATRDTPNLDVFWVSDDADIVTTWFAGDHWNDDGPVPLDPGAFARRGGGRWYPTLVTLPGGTVLAAGGHPAESDTRHWNDTPEIYDPLTGHWRLLGPLGGGDLVQYPRAHLLPDGRVFFATPLDEANRAIAYTTQSGDFDHIGSPLPDGYLARDIVNAASYASVLLPLTLASDYRARVLLVGGRTPLEIDLDANDPDWAPTPPRALTHPSPSPTRLNCNATLLADGTVLVTGGVAKAKSDADAVLHAELYDAQSRTWSVFGPASRPRNYHSVALLMPDGAVWVAGSNRNCDPSSNEIDTHEKVIEIFRPPYWFAERPTVTAADTRLTDNGELVVTCPQATSIRQVAIVRAGSTTHAFDADQRWVELAFTVESDDTIRVGHAPSPTIAPPGVYLLVVIDDRRVPSVGRFIDVG